MDCITGKVIYPSTEKAEAMAAIMQVRYRVPFRVYGCPDCGCFHITRQIDNASRYPVIDVEGMLLKAIEDNDAKVIDYPSPGVIRYRYAGYIFLHTPGGRSIITVEHSPGVPQPITDHLIEAVQSGSAKFLERVSNSVRVFEFEKEGKVYVFTYNKSTKNVIVDDVRSVGEE